MTELDHIHTKLIDTVEEVIEMISYRMLEIKAHYHVGYEPLDLDYYRLEKIRDKLEEGLKVE